MQVTIIACRRHELLLKTLESFHVNLFRWVEYADPWEAIINIDPVGIDKSAIDCIDVCNIFFKKVTVRTPETPNFSEAFKWVWSKVTSEYVLHLEDDWKLLRKVDLGDVFDILETEPNLALLRLPQFKAGHDSMKNWNLHFPFNGRYYECPETLKMSAGFCGHPSIIRGEFVRRTWPHINTTINPEKQFHRGPKELMKEVARWRYGVYAKPNDPPAIQDLGRKWMIANKLRKQGNKAWFTRWEEDNGESS